MNHRHGDSGRRRDDSRRQGGANSYAYDVWRKAASRDGGTRRDAPPNIRVTGTDGRQITSRNTSTGGRETSYRDANGDSVSLRAGGGDGFNTNVTSGPESLSMGESGVDYRNGDFRVSGNDDRVRISGGDNSITYNGRTFDVRQGGNSATLSHREMAQALIQAALDRAAQDRRH